MLVEVPVEEVAGALYALISETETLTLRVNGNPCPPPSNGWTILGFNRGLLPLQFLELNHPQHGRASWIFDETGVRIGVSVASLEESWKAKAREIVRAHIVDALQGIVDAADIGPGQRPLPIEALAPRTTEALIALCSGFNVNEPRVIYDVAAGVTLTLREGRDVLLPHASITAALTPDLQQSYAEACRSGVMCWPSPVDGELVDEVRGFPLSSILMAWRCTDRRNGLVFYVLACGHDQTVSGLYFPNGEVLIIGPRRRYMTIDLTKYPYQRLLSEHTIRHFTSIRKFIGTPVKKFAHFLFPESDAHIGHYLWNELPGLERIAAQKEKTNLQSIKALSSATGADFFGPLVEIFPELGKYIETDLSSLSDLCKWAYSNEIQPLRFSGSYVSSALRTRIQGIVESNAVLATARQATKDHRGATVVFGLRVENRTLSDLVGFFVPLARALAARFGPLTIIMDGHNQKVNISVGQSFKSHLENRASRTPIDVEREIVDSLRMHLANQPIHIIDCIGMSVVENLAWISVADFFVAPWGAGLAKYRWAMNKPGYVVTNKISLIHKSDLRIYDDSDCMGNPSPQYFVRMEDVIDQPSAPLLLEREADVRNFFINFDVVLERVVPDICEMLQRTLDARTTVSS